jgi:trehalose-6-phosphate synthase
MVVSLTESPNAAIGFFLHIPFQSREIFSIRPRREELLQGLLGADLVAFQTHGHLQQFRAPLLRVLGVESRVTEVAVGSRAVRLEALPIGIAPEEYTGQLERDEATANYYADWVSRYEGRNWLVNQWETRHTELDSARLHQLRNRTQRARGLL